MRLIEVHTGNVRCVAYSPDGRTLATGSNDRTVQLLDVATGDVKATLRDFTAPVVSVAFSHDGALLTAGECSPCVRVWHTANLDAPPRVLVSTPSVMRSRDWIGDVSCLAFSPAGRVLFVGCGERHVWCKNADMAVWDFTGDDPVKLAGQVLIGGVWSVAVVADGTGFILGTALGSVRLFSPPRWRAAGTHDQGRGVNSLAVSPDGKTIVAATGYEILLCDLVSRDRLRKLHGHRGKVNSLVCHPSGSLLASASNDKTVRLWDVSSGRERAVLHFGIGKAHAIAFAPDGMTAALAGDKGLVIWDAD